MDFDYRQLNYYGHRKTKNINNNETFEKHWVKNGWTFKSTYYTLSQGSRDSGVNTIPLWKKPIYLIRSETKNKYNVCPMNYELLQLYLYGKKKKNEYEYISMFPNGLTLNKIKKKNHILLYNIIFVRQT